MKVLDIGCGKHKLEGAIGLDINKDSNADIIGNAEEFSFYEEFDLVVLRQVLEHSNSLRMIQAVYRFLKRGGIVFIETPNAFDLPKIIRFFKEDWYTADTGHIQTFGVFELHTLLENNGFKVLRHGYKKMDTRFGTSKTLKTRIQSLVVRFKPQFNNVLWIEGSKV